MAALRFIDLFSGIGAFHVALKRLGARCVFACEIDEAARLTYETNFRRIEPRLFANGNFARDIGEVDAGSIPNFDLLAGGWPCQSVSQDGHKRGFEDSRGSLFFDIARIIEAKRPTAYFLENVPHLLIHDGGRTFATVRNILEGDLGYSLHHKVIRARDFNLPQHRARLFMVGFRNRRTSFEFPKPVRLARTMSHVFDGDCDRRIGHTLRVCGRGSGIHDRRNWDSYIVDGEVRRLTPKEGKRMMGFPGSFRFPVAESCAMKLLGNSVAINCVLAVGRQVIRSLQERTKPHAR